MSAGLWFASTVDEDISVSDEVKSDVLCPSVEVDAEKGEVPVVQRVDCTVNHFHL